MKPKRHPVSRFQLEFISSGNRRKFSLPIVLAICTATLATGCPNQTANQSTSSPETTASTTSSPVPVETPTDLAPTETPSGLAPIESPSGLAPIESPSGLTPIPTPSSLPTSNTSQPGEKSQVVKQLEVQIANLLNPQLGVPITSVSCPNNIKIEAGSKYDCEAVADNTPFTVEVNIQDAQGGFKVNSKGIVLLPKIERSIAANVKQQKGIDITVNCGGRIKVARTGDTFECPVTLPDGKTQPAKITVNDDYGNVRFEL
jgi:hypothetical protein